MAGMDGWRPMASDRRTTLCAGRSTIGPVLLLSECSGAGAIRPLLTGVLNGLTAGV
jgi:hypothetical protein